MTQIHPTAIVDAKAKLADSVVIGPYCIVGPEVELGENVRLFSHVVVAGRTAIGADTRVFPFASIGHEPQDLKYKGEESRLAIGAGNTIREHVTMNPGTTGGGMVTEVGDRNLFMVGVHVAKQRNRGNVWKFTAEAKVEGRLVAEATYAAMILDE